MLHQEVDTVLLEGDGEGFLLAHSLQHFHVIDIQFIAAGRTLIRSYPAGHDDTRFLRQAAHPLKNFRRHRGFGHNPLHRAGPVAEDGEEQLPACAQVVEPSPERDLLSFVPVQGCDCGQWCSAQGIGHGQAFVFVLFCHFPIRN